MAHLSGISSYPVQDLQGRSELVLGNGGSGQGGGGPKDNKIVRVQWLDLVTSLPRTPLLARTAMSCPSIFTTSSIL